MKIYKNKCNFINLLGLEHATQYMWVAKSEGKGKKQGRGTRVLLEWN